MSKVLVVEDSKLISSLVKNKIESELNHEVFCVSSYMDALKIISNKESEFLVALLGLYLPDAPNGEIVDYIISKNIPAIIFTGEYSDEVREKIWSKKVVDYVFKESGHNLDYLMSLIQRIERNKNIKILLVDNNDDFRSEVSELLQVHQYTVLDACNGKEALEAIENNPDCKMVIIDYNLPEIDGFKLTKNIREIYTKEELAIIGMSGNEDATISVRFIKNGANDFIIKPFLSEEFYCRVTQNIELIEHIKAIKDVSNIDYLTRLYNRRYFFELGSKMFANAKRENVKITIAMIDVDYFKKVNDTYGHDAGDIVLQEMAMILKGRFRESDIVSRFGGEEFCIMAVNMDLEHTIRIFDELRKTIEQTEIDIGEKKIRITVSIGICARFMDSLDGMIKQADKMLYAAKERGRNKVILLK